MELNTKNAVNFCTIGISIVLFLLQMIFFADSGTRPYGLSALHGFVGVFFLLVALMTAFFEVPLQNLEEVQGQLVRFLPMYKDRLSRLPWYMFIGLLMCVYAGEKFRSPFRDVGYPIVYLIFGFVFFGIGIAGAVLHVTGPAGTPKEAKSNDDLKNTGTRTAKEAKSDEEGKYPGTNTSSEADVVEKKKSDTSTPGEVDVVEEKSSSAKPDETV